MKLQRNAEVTREIAAGETHVYELAMEANQLVVVSADQRGIDLAVALEGPNAKPILEVDSPTGRHGPERLQVVTDDAGTYRLRVRAIEENAPAGSYHLVVEELRTAAPEDRRKADAERILAQADASFMAGSKESRREAAGLYDEALTLWRELSDRPREADIRLRLGWTYRELKEYENAESALRDARQIYAEVGERYSEGLALNSLGGLRIRLGENREALAWSEQALKIGRDLRNAFLTAESLNNLGIAQRRLGDIDAAIAAYSEARGLYEELHESFFVARSSYHLGFLLLRQGELETAADHLQAALEIWTNLKEPIHAARALNVLGDVRKRQGRLREATDYLQQALELRRQVQDRRGEAVTLNSLGTTHLLLGTTLPADENVQEFTQARRCYETALGILEEVGDSAEKAMTLVNLGRLDIEEGNPESALKRHREAAPLIQDEATEVSNHYGMARALHDLGRFEEAREYLEKTLAMVEGQREGSRAEDLRIAFFATKQHYHELQVDVLMHLHESAPEAGHDAAAFEATERFRSRALLEALGTDAAKVPEEANPLLLEKEKTLQAELNDLAVNGTEKEQREKAFELAIVRGSLRLELTRPEHVTLEEAQRMIRAGTVVLSYSLGEERSFLWRITNDGMKHYVLPGRAEIEPVVETARALLVSRKPSVDEKRRQVLADLSNKLLGPVASELEDQRLVIVAQGALLYVPFAVLPGPDGMRDAPDHLVRRHEIVHLPSVSVLRRLRERALTRDPSPRQLAIFADPVFSFKGSSRKAAEDRDLRRAIEATRGTRSENVEFKPLPHTRKEAEEILKVARGDKMSALGFEATKEKVLTGGLAEYQILHFATHGLTNRRQPELSGLVLSLFNEHGERQDGFLRLHEICNLDLPAELVVLSACETGLGRRVRGEGLLGLTRGFLYAGASRVVVSLWSVDDEATAELMKRFYWSLLDAQVRPAQALRVAQLALLEEEEWRHPYYWAGFVFQGEWWPPGEEPPIGTAQGGSEEEDESDRDYPGPDDEWCEHLPEPWMQQLCHLLQGMRIQEGGDE